MAEVTRVIKIRLYPTSNQETLIRKTIGSCRFVYNQMLAERKEVYERLKDNRAALKNYSYTTEKELKVNYRWLSEVDSVALQQARIDLNKAFQNFFKSLKGQRKGRRVGYPSFRKKSNGGTYRTIARYIEMDEVKRKIRLPKLGWVKYRDNRLPEGEIKSVTVSMTPTGKFFASVNYRTEFFAPPVDITNPKTIGLDMKMNGGFVESQGNTIPFPRWMRDTLTQLRKEQRKLAKKVKGSNNWHKQRYKVAKYHEKVVNQRQDFLHKLSRKLVDEYQVIAIEDLNLQGMAKFHFGKSVADNSWATFVRFLEYKAFWYGATIYIVDRYFPSSKMCGECGHKEQLTLADREWVCPICGTHHDRDVNAAKNIEWEACRFLGIDRGGARPSLEESSKTEISVSASA